MDADGFPSHFRLMLLAARVQQPEHAEALRALAAGIQNWDDLLAATLHHRLAPQVLKALAAANVAGIPEFVTTRLERRDAANRAHATRLLLDYQRVEAYFARHGFALALLKGPALSAMLHGDFAARHCGDLDLLTSERALPEQMRLMKELGYVVDDPQTRITAPRLEVYRRYWKGMTFLNPASGASVDLHWRLFSNRRHPGNMLNAMTEIQVSGASIQTHTLEHQFLYSALHGTWDSWCYLKGLADVAASLHRLTPAQLESALQEAARLRLLPQVSSAVRLAQELLDAPGGDRGLLAADEPSHRVMRRFVLRRLRQSGYKPARLDRGAAEGFLFERTLVPGARAAAEIVKRYLWRPRVWQSFDLPDAWLWLTPVLGALTPPRGKGAKLQLEASKRQSAAATLRRSP